MNNSVLDVMFGSPTVRLMEDGETLGITHSTYKDLLEAAKVVEQECRDLRVRLTTTSSPLEDIFATYYHRSLLNATPSPMED